MIISFFKFIFKLLLTLLVLFVIVILLIISLAFYLVNRDYQFDQHEVPVELPSSLGGGMLPVYVSGVINLDLEIGDAFHTDADLVLSIDQDSVKEALPTREFSLLVGETDYPQISSMLGRLKFARDNATLGKVENAIFLATQLEGEFYVQEKREYEKDEEQPGSGEPLPISVDMIASVEGLALTPQWGLTGTIDVNLELDEKTRAALDGRYGQGQDFANYLESVLNERAKALAAKLDPNDVNLLEKIIEPLHKADQNKQGQYSNMGLHLVSVDEVEADTCPSVDDNGNVMFGFLFKGHVVFEEKDLTEIPDLSLRQGSC